MAQQGKERVLEKLELAVTELRTGGVTLTAADFESGTKDEPPTAVAAAGLDFVGAWYEYHRALSLRKSLSPKPPSQRGKNLLESGDEYSRLISELLDGANPPLPEQLAQFFYSDYSWCGTDSGTFASANNQAILLACLRHRRFGEAVQMLLNSPSSDKLRADLLTALGFDWRKVVAGAWLDGKYGMLESVCKDGSEEMAQLALRWSEQHWDEAVAKYEEDKRRQIISYVPKPQLPALEMLHLLADGNTVTPATKALIATFLHANGTRIHDAGIWLRKPPQGAAQWLKPMARAALQHDRNEVRNWAEQVLRDAGETDVKAELRPAARYRLFVNGELWPLGMPKDGYLHLGLNVEFGPVGSHGGLATSADPDREGIITTNPDHFVSKDVVRGANFYSMPSSFWKPASPAEPWIRAEIPLPPAFGETTDIRVKTVQVAIAPRFPRPPRDGDASVTKIEFTWSDDGREPNANSQYYHLIGRGPLILARVQPGDYWLRVRAPGAALGPWEKVQIAKAKTLIEPKLMIGASVSVPLKWPEELKLETLDPDLADLFRRAWWAGLPGFFTIERNGQAFPWAAPEKDAGLDGPKEEALSLRNLPVGKYHVRLRSSKEIRADLKYLNNPEQNYLGWKAAEVSFEVNARSPQEFTTPSLNIEPRL